MTQNELLEKIKEVYDNDLCYFEGEINGELFKIRMNKDHARNGARNDDRTIHNLSLINTACPSGVGFKRVGSAVQVQVDNIMDWNSAEEAILDFFYDIERGY